jgi:hypothetical protein
MRPRGFLDDRLFSPSPKTISSPARHLPEVPRDRFGELIVGAHRDESERPRNVLSFAGELFADLAPITRSSHD